MNEIIFRGTFETNEPKVFLDAITQVLKDTDTIFNGQTLQFNIKDYTESEVKTKINEPNNDTNAGSSDNGPNEG